MAAIKSIGAIEFSSIGVGYQVQDQMLKAASVQVLLARTICSGKYFVIVGGNVGDVSTAIRTGLEAAEEAVIDSLVIPNVHESVFAALGQSVVLEKDKVEALGVVETFGGTAIIAASDAAAKAARVTLFRIHVAMALGGKGFCLMTGTIGDVRSGVTAAANEARTRGLLVSEAVIARPSDELFSEYV